MAWYIDLDGTLTNYSYKDYENDLWLHHPEVLTKKRPRVKFLPPEWIILSRYSTEKEAALKRAWCQKYFPDNGLLLTPIDKHLFVDAKGSYLIDDYNKNLDDWKRAGGIPIKILNNINSPRKDIPSVSFKDTKKYFELMLSEEDTFYCYRKETRLW